MPQAGGITSRAVLGGLHHQYLIFGTDRYLFRATELDPSYGAVTGSQLVCHFWQKVFGWISPSDPSIMEGVRLAHVAARTGANDSEALWMAAQTAAILAGEFEIAVGWVEKSISINPNSSNAWAISAAIYGYLGDSVKALDHIARARRLDPIEFPFVSYWASVAHIHMAAGHLEDVVRSANKGLHEGSNVPTALRMKIAACGLLGRREEGRASVEQLLALNPDTTVARLKAHYAPVLGRNPERFEQFLNGLRLSGLAEGEPV